MDVDPTVAGFLVLVIVHGNPQYGSELYSVTGGCQEVSTLRGIEWETTLLRYSVCHGALAEIVFNWRKIDSAALRHRKRLPKQFCCLRCAIRKGIHFSASKMILSFA